MEHVKEHINNIIEKISQANEIINKIGISLDGKKLNNEFDAIFFDLLLRQHFILRGTSALLEKVDVHYWKFPISIQLRVGLVDYITLNYLLTFLGNETLLKSNYESLSKITLKLLQNEIDETKIKDLFEKHFTSFPNGLKGVDQLTIKDMADKIDQGKKVYLVYQKLSQYEHFNKFSIPLLENNFMLDDLKEFYFVILHIFTTVFQIIQILVQDGKDDLLKELDNIYSNLLDSQAQIDIKYTK